MERNSLLVDLTLFLDEQYSLRFVDLLQLHFDNLPVCCLHLSAYKSGFNWQLAMSAIDQYTQLHTLWAAMAKESVHARAGGSTRIKDIVHQHDIFAGDRKA